MKVSLLLISLFSFAAISKDYKPNMEELKLNKIKETKKSYSAGESVPYKRASNASRLSNIEVKGVTNTNREQNLKRYIQINKEESEDSTTLKLSLNYLEPKLKDPNKYRIKSVNYHFGDGNIQNTALANVNGEDFITLDISSLSVGSYTASIELVIQKNEDLRASGNKNKLGSDFKPILLTYSVEFEKVDSAFLVINEYLRPEGLWSIGLDLSESYSEGGEILNYKVETFFEGELDFSATITFNRFSISFNQIGEWKIIITMTDSLGDTDTKELIYNVTNARPVLAFDFAFNEEIPGAIDIDMSGSSDDGGEIVEYATFFLNDGQFSNYLAHGPKVTRSLLRSGVNRICFRVVDNTGVDRVSCTNIEYNGPINPFFTLIDIIPTDIIDPRLYVVEDSCTVPEGRSVGEYVYNYDNGELFLELRTQDEFFDIFFPEPGVWNIEAFCTDDLGNKSNVVNLEINAEFELIKPDAFVELVRLEDDITGLTYAVNNEDSVPSPYSDFIDEFIYQGKNLETGETFSYNFDFPFNDVVFPSYGNWEITYTVIDGTGIKSEPYVFNINVERPLIKPIANISIAKNEQDNTDLGFKVIDETSNPGSSNIVSYKFTFNKVDSTETFSITPPQPYIFFSFPSFGIWNLEYSVTNEQGLVSDPFTTQINVEATLPIANVLLTEDTSDPTGLLYNVASENSSIGSGNSLVEYKYTLLNINTGEMQELIFNNPFNMIQFSSAGLWSINYVVKNDLGLISSPLSFTVDVMERFKPSFEFNLIEITSPFLFGIEIINEKVLANDPFARYDVLINNSGLISYLDSSFELPPFTQSGDYKITIQAITTSGKITDPQSIMLNVNVDTIGNDIIPNDPGENGLLELTGIDSDRDGVRDDVEIAINTTFSNEDSTVRTSVLNYGRLLQELVSINANKSPSRQNGIDLLNISSSLKKCLEKNFTDEEDVEYIHAELFANQFNTIERIRFYLKAQVEANGMETTNEDYFSSSCSL